VPVRRLRDRKDVVVRPNMTSTPANGYWLSAVQVEPSTVTLTGSEDLLAEIPGFVETSPFSLAGATSEVQAELTLVLPDGVSIQDGTEVIVTAEITPIEGGKTVQRTPILENLEQDLEASIDLEAVDVIVSGPVAQIESLREEDVRVVLDLDGLLAGSHTVTPQVELPEGVSLQTVLPATVEVTIILLNEPENGVGDPNPSDNTTENEIAPAEGEGT
jgi:YbbR domain-containing protein